MSGPAKRSFTSFVRPAAVPPVAEGRNPNRRRNPDRWKQTRN